MVQQLTSTLKITWVDQNGIEYQSPHQMPKGYKKAMRAQLLQEIKEMEMDIALGYFQRANTLLFKKKLLAWLEEK